MYLFDFFDSIYPLSDQTKQDFLTIAKRRKYKVQHQLLSIGEICNKIYVVESGMVRSFYYDEKGRDITSWIVAENDAATQPNSLFHQIPSPEVMETVEDSVLWEIDAQGLLRLQQQYHDLALLRLRITEVYLLRYEERARVLRRVNVKQRYLRLLETFSHIVSRAPQGHIASYLGMDLATLSRVRAEIAQKKQ
ncbi:MAG: Crp/Fnr family transcriptional regulator [Spirosomataceae bacterium]